MTEKEKKELLLQDLSARLPYRVVVDYAHNAFALHKGEYVKKGSKCILDCYLLDVFISPRQNENGEYIKPYLFPLSSMTEEQKVIYGDLCYDVIRSSPEYTQSKLNELYDWLNKNYLDYRGLIPMGMAIDATGLNLYKL